MLMRFVIKHCVYFEGTKKIKLTLTRYGNDLEEIEMDGREFKEYVKRLRVYRKTEKE